MDKSDLEYWKGWHDAIEAAKELLFQRIEPRAASLLDELRNVPDPRSVE